MNREPHKCPECGGIAERVDVGNPCVKCQVERFNRQSAPPAPPGDATAGDTDKLVEALIIATPGGRLRQNAEEMAALCRVCLEKPYVEVMELLAARIAADARELRDLRAGQKIRTDHGGTVSVWKWQGDGTDHPESLVCDVLMTAAQLRGLLAAPRATAADGQATKKENA